MTGLMLTITSHRAPTREILDSLKTCAADGGARPNCGGTPFRQPCPAYPSTMGGRHRRNVSARKASDQRRIGNAFFKSFAGGSLPTRQQNPQHTTSLDVLAEPNYYSKCVRTSSTQVFASHSPDDGTKLSRGTNRAEIAIRLPIPFPASTLQVFQFIR